MDTAGYTTLTRQSGLMHEMQVVANNIANISTTGFRREGVVFEEYIAPTQDGPSLSMASGNARVVDLTQAGLSPVSYTHLDVYKRQGTSSGYADCKAAAR